MSSPTEAHYSTINGVPLYYFRYADGKARRVSIYSTYAFKKRLNQWVAALGKVSRNNGGPRYGAIERIVTAGAYVNRSGQHGEGTAFDLDQIRWKGGIKCTPYRHVHAARSRSHRRRYLALDAMTRRHFRYVLDGWYNSAHADHIHLDFGGRPTTCSRGSRSDTVFVQSLCNNLISTGIAGPVDGIWGSQTEAAFQTSLRRVRVGGDPFGNRFVWRRYLWRVAMHGFADRALGHFNYKR
ncbi:MAG: extensin family protein [Egibacteraceae bacterium]